MTDRFITIFFEISSCKVDHRQSKDSKISYSAGEKQLILMQALDLSQQIAHKNSIPLGNRNALTRS